MRRHLLRILHPPKDTNQNSCLAHCHLVVLDIWVGPYMTSTTNHSLHLDLMRIAALAERPHFLKLSKERRHNRCQLVKTPM